jgi:drug/metabolite transporter (DMT)-like permease
MFSTPLSRRAKLIGWLCALTVLVLWTAFILVARASARQQLTSFDIAWLRFVFSGAVVLPLLWWRGRALRANLGATPGQAWRRGAALALTAGVGYCSLAYSGFFFAPAAHAAVLMPGSLPLWTALLAVLLLGEHITATRAAGLALIAAGGLLVGGTSLLQAFDGSGTWRGDALFLASGMVWSLYGVLCRRWQVSALHATMAIALGCLLSYVPVYGAAAWAGLVPSHLGSAPWRELLFQAVFQGGLSMWLAGLAFTQVVQTFGPLRATMATAMVPPLAALAAVPVLGETLGGAALGGLLCVTLGLFLGLYWGSPAARPAAPAVAAPLRTPA